MITIENEFLKVSVRDKGAELTSILDKTNNIEHLWQADPRVWAWHAPNLFPVIGECIDKTLFVDSKSYKMDRHGFARQSTFVLQDSTPTHALFSLPFSEATLSNYPYKFEFQIEYSLAGKRLDIIYRVLNKDDKTIYFSVGGHPAFNIPFTKGENYHDYYVEFKADKTLTRHLLSDSGLFNGETETILLDEQKLNLTKDLFNKDALVFKDLQSTSVRLKSRKHNQSLSVNYSAFTYLGIWAKPGADFVCIEPWLGCADTEGRRVDLKQKEAIQHVGVNKNFTATYSIEIGG